MKVYIAGRMKGLEDYNRKNFIQAEKYLKRIGFKEVINPYKLSLKLKEKLNLKEFTDIKRSRYLKNDIKELIECDVIALLPSYVNSKGAKMELHIARELRMGIFYINEEDLK